MLNAPPPPKGKCRGNMEDWVQLLALIMDSSSTGARDRLGWRAATAIRREQTTLSE